MDGHEAIIKWPLCVCVCVCVSRTSGKVLVNAFSTGRMPYASGLMYPCALEVLFCASHQKETATRSAVSHHHQQDRFAGIQCGSLSL
jgi:hypothetical protein